MKLYPIMDQVPQGVQHALTGGAVAGGWAAFMGLIQTVFGALAAVLSFIWLAMQIYSWWEKRRAPK